MPKPKRNKAMTFAQMLRAAGVTENSAPPPPKKHSGPMTAEQLKVKGLGGGGFNKLERI